MDVVLLRADPSPLLDLDGHRSGYNVAGCEVLRRGGVPDRVGRAFCFLILFCLVSLIVIID